MDEERRVRNRQRRVRSLRVVPGWHEAEAADRWSLRSGPSSLCESRSTVIRRARWTRWRRAAGTDRSRETRLRERQRSLDEEERLRSSQRRENRSRRLAGPERLPPDEGEA